MAITRSKKEEILQDLIERTKGAKAIYFARNDGMTVAQTQDFRRAVVAESGTTKVAKKTLIVRAASEIDVTIDINELDGAVSAVFANEDEIAPVKVVSKFAKDTEKMAIVGAIFDGEWYGADKAIALSQIPGKQELLARLVGSMQSPISGFVAASSNVIGGMVRVLDGVREQKAANGEA